MLTSCEMGNYERNEYIYSSVRLKHTMYVIYLLVPSLCQVRTLRQLEMQIYTEYGIRID